MPDELEPPPVLLPVLLPVFPPVFEFPPPVLELLEPDEPLELDELLLELFELDCEA